MQRILLLILFTFSCFSHSSSHLTVCVSNSTHPYVLPELNSGLDVEIIQSALNNSDQMNSRIKFVYLPNARIKYSFNKGDCDIATQAKEDSSWKNAIYSKYPMITFDNKAITLEKNNISLESIRDIKNYTTLAWQGAHQYLGDEFYEVTLNHKNYTELSTKLPSDMLLLERVDLVISEVNVFRYNLSKHSNSDEIIRYQKIFKTGNEYKWVFTSRKLRQSFEEGLKASYHNGAIDQIFEHYVNTYDIDRSAYRTMDCFYGGITQVCN